MATIKYAADYTNIEELVEFWETHPFGDDREAPTIDDSTPDDSALTDVPSKKKEENAKASLLTSYSPAKLKKASIFFKLAPASKIEKINDSYSLFDYRYCRFSKDKIGTLLLAETNAVIIEKDGVTFIEQELTMHNNSSFDNDFQSLVDSVLL